MFCCLTASTARELLCMAGLECRMQVVEAVVACPEPELCHQSTSVEVSGMTRPGKAARVKRGLIQALPLARRMTYH